MPQSNETLPEAVTSPFGGDARLTQVLSTGFIAELYMRKCGAEVSPFFRGAANIGLYECLKTGYRFWRPDSVAGDEEFYRLLSRAWPDYYHESRWEYSAARRLMSDKKSVLEIGCGKGYFLRSVESMVENATGLELNQEAIRDKVTKFPILCSAIQDFAAESPSTFDVVCAFQVLEHVVDPCSFIESALACLVDGGLLAISTPNNDYVAHRRQEDAFDLPPHHMGHFDVSTYERLASYFSVRVLDVSIEPRRCSPPAASPGTRHSFTFRLANLISSNLYSAAFALNREPGANMLVVLQKS